jgi:bacterioferritin-associated ferredoxin
MILCICNRITETDVRKAARAGAPTPERAYGFCCIEV